MGFFLFVCFVLGFVCLLGLVLFVLFVNLSFFCEAL